MRSLLEDIGGYTVVEACDGVEALTILRASVEPLVVLLDLLMPGLDGMDVLRQVAADENLARKHAYVLVTVSRLAQPLEFPPSVEMEVPVVSKPFDMDQLLSIVAAAERKISSRSGTA
jgi:CheY-like chemotaxis protein